MRSSLLAIASFVALSSSSLTAQTGPDFSKLKIKIGDTIYVTDRRSGVEVSGPLTRVSPSELSIDGYAIKAAPGLKIERRGDPVWDGLLMGLFGGMAVGSMTAAGECSVNRPGWQCTVESGAGFALIGAFIDWRHVGRTTVFHDPDAHRRTALRLLPQISEGRKGLAMALTF